MELFSFILTLGLTPLVILLAIHLYLNRSRRGRWIDEIPGPKGLPIIGNALDLNLSHEEFFIRLRKYGKDFYPIYKYRILHWTIVNIQHPDDIEIILSSHKNIEKGRVMDLLRPWINEGLIIIKGDKWRSRRKLLTRAFSLNILEKFVEIFSENTDRLVATLKAESTAQSGGIVKELASLFSNVTLQMICETAMGITLDEKDSIASDYMQAIRVGGDIFNYRSVRPWLKNEWIFSLTKKGKEQQKALKVRHEFSSKIIQARKDYHRENGGKYLNVLSEGTDDAFVGDMRKNRQRLAFLDLLIVASESSDDQWIEDEVNTFAIAGHDTTAMALFFTTLLLAEHKDIQAKCREEINEVGNQSTNGKMTMRDLQKLHYLQQCIKEAMRLYPATFEISRELVEDVQLKNHFLPRGTTVNIQMFQTHRNPEFWPEPNSFDPDRFSPERSKGRHPYSYLPFSLGPRNCIGYNFAMLELKTVLAGLLSNFYLEPVDVATDAGLFVDFMIRYSHPKHVKLIPISI